MRSFGVAEPAASSRRLGAGGASPLPRGETSFAFMEHLKAEIDRERKRRERAVENAGEVL